MILLDAEKYTNTRVFPHDVLDWHEVVNDRDVSLTYCPLTGSTVAVNRLQMGNSDLGVSGLLYKNNLIAYDRRTDSYWSQMLLESVRGQKKGERLFPLPYIETTVATARKMFPDKVSVLTSRTGYTKPYGFSPYGEDYSSISYLVFNMEVDGRRHPKDRVLGVLADNTRHAAAKTYPIAEAEAGVEVINDRVGGKAVVVIRSGPDNLALVYERYSPDHGELTFEIDSASGEPVDVYPVNLRDRETGTVWNILGRAVSGELEGENLSTPVFMTAYCFAWAGFYPQTEIYRQ